MAMALARVTIASCEKCGMLTNRRDDELQNEAGGAQEGRGAVIAGGTNRYVVRVRILFAGGTPPPGVFSFSRGFVRSFFVSTPA